MPRKYADMAERLLANCVVSETSAYGGSRCWDWIGATTTNRGGLRYGKLSVRIKRGPRKGQLRTLKAHRAAIEAFTGRRMTRRHVGKHLCNNTLCINPAHLQGGTQRSNVRQCVKDGRHRNGSTGKL